MTIRLEAIVKDYPGTRALNGVDLEIRAGEVHGIIGENGAGKSTLMKILAGLIEPSSGRILVNGSAVAPGHPRTMIAAGVGYLSQEGSLIPYFTGVENILLGNEPGGYGVLDRGASRRQAFALLEEYFPGKRVDLDVAVSTLPPADQKVVEVLRALRNAASVLILDEPTASLPEDDRKRLDDVIRRLAARGKAVILISHFLAEVLRLSDRVTVLRDGARVLTVQASETDEAGLVSAMLGGTLLALRQRQSGVGSGKPNVSVRGWSGEGFRNVDLDIPAGEIVGLIGLTRAGHFQFAESLFAARGHDGGTLLVGGVETSLRSVGDALRLGLALVPDQRMVNSLTAEWSIAENLSLPHLERTRVARTPFISQSREIALSTLVRDRLRIKSSSVQQQVGELSGGNKQKVSLGKWLFGVNPAERYRLIIVIEPTEGVDVGAKEEIHSILSGLVAEGVSVLLVSSDLNEVATLSHRIYVFADQRVQRMLKPEEFNEDAMLSAMASASHSEVAAGGVG